MASPAWQRRNSAARALGYRSYYDYRVHDYGRRPATSSVEPSDRPRLRGHRSEADLLRTIRDGSLVAFNGADRDPATGRFRWVEIAVVSPDGRERVYRLSGKQVSAAKLKALLGSMSSAGAITEPLRAYLEVRKG
jgi:hypothetical protein